MKKLCLFIFILFIACSSTEVNQRDYIITFKDSNLEYYIRESIKKPEGDIFLSDLEKIGILFVSNVENLSGIEYCKNLKTISLSDSPKCIKDINLLPTKNIDGLYLINCDISDISFILEFENLTNLRLNQNSIKDLSVLSKLKYLKWLILDNNEIDVSTIKEMENVSYFSLNDNKIEDISFVKNLKKVYFLFLNRNNIEDISPLSELDNLQFVECDNNKITSLPKLSKTIKSLSFCYNKINDISKISNLENVQNILLSNNEIKDITPLSGLSKLKALLIINNNLDLRPGTPNREIVDKLIEAGVEVVYKEGNIIE